ncbi:MAG TPA: undecaprenyl-diphosphate phosphatase [Miltoncostaeaceae bacterium]|nr:undecaprenyl-diphosphate phosphatase [Miltoncostaeaceae bacterium]
MTITYLQSAVLGALQGVSELFPISSLGHSVVIPQLLGWDIHQNDAYFLAFLVATHLATALVLLGFFFRDWLRIFRGLGRSIRRREIAPADTDARLGWLLIVGTVPAGIAGLLLEHTLRHLFASAHVAALALMVNGVLLLGAQRLRRRAPADGPEQPDARIARGLSWRSALGVGAAQALALIPGISRSGAAMGGGLLAGLCHEGGGRFAFLLATPIIGAAAILKLPELMGPAGDGVRGPALVGALFAAGSAYLAVRVLMRYLRAHTLTPFGIYCLLAGGVATLILTVG